MTPEQAQEVLDALASLKSDVQAIHYVNQHLENLESLMIHHVYTLYAVIGVVIAVGLVLALAFGFSHFR